MGPRSAQRRNDCVAGHGADGPDDDAGEQAFAMNGSTRVIFTIWNVTL